MVAIFAQLIHALMRGIGAVLAQRRRNRASLSPPTGALDPNGLVDGTAGSPAQQPAHVDPEGQERQPDLD